MRIKDDNKLKSILNSSLELINKHGFADISMSKIAKKAGVSPATIYIYFKDKEDLIKKTFKMVKSQFDESVKIKFEINLNLQKMFSNFWNNFFDFSIENKEHFKFMEQFLTYPNANKSRHSEMSVYNSQIIDIIKEGKSNGTLKNLPDEIILILSLSPIIQLIKSHINGEIEVTREKLHLAFQGAWEAIAF